MNILNTPAIVENYPTNCPRDQIELEHKIKTYISHVKVSEWCYHFNRILISPGDSFNVKYFIKFLSSTLAKPIGTSETCVPSTVSSYNNRLVPQTVMKSQLYTTLNKNEVVEDDGLLVSEEDYVSDTLDRLSSTEFIELLDIERTKRLGTIKSQYRMFNDILKNTSMDDMKKLNNGILTEVPYEIYIEATEHNNIQLNIKDELNHAVNKVKSDDLLKILKTLGVLVIDISRDIAALSRGKEIFRSFIREIANLEKKKNTDATKNKRLIILVSTVMTWAGVSNKYTVRKNYDMNNRLPNPAFEEHYKFELEVLDVNQTIGLKEIVSTVIIWTGFTYGYEQDLFRFAFNSACQNTNAFHEFPVPNSQNYIPVIHIQNLARLIHKVISENKQLLKYNNCIFAVESPINTLKQIITALGKTCESRNSTSVSLNTFINNYKLKGLHKQMISVDIKVNWNIKQVWPNFKWYGGKSSITNSMKSLVDIYKREHNIEILKLHILGPAASDKTILAHRIAEHYNLIYLDPHLITQNLVNEIREEIMLIHLKMQYSVSEIDSLEHFEDENNVKEVDQQLNKKILELNQKLEKLYASMDFNDGVLEDEYLIPLLNKEISHSIFTQRGYILNGYPSTTHQAEELFDNTSSPQQIDVNKLPSLVVFVKQSTQRDPSRFNDGGVLNTKSTKIKIGFEESNDENYFAQNPSTGDAEVFMKPILKKSMKNYYLNSGTGKFDNWNEEYYDDLVKMFNRYYVPIKIVDSSTSSLDLNQLNSSNKYPDIEPILNTIIKEIEQNQLHELFKYHTTSQNETDSIYKEIDVERAQYEHLKEKMKLLEEFGNLLDFERIDSLSRDEYLMKYCSLNLSKLIVQVAKLKPKNAVGFLAYMALKEYPESLLHCPGYYKESVKIQKLLKSMYNIFDPDNAVFSKSELEMSMVCSSSDENVNENEEGTYETNVYYLINE